MLKHGIITYTYCCFTFIKNTCCINLLASLFNINIIVKYIYVVSKNFTLIEEGKNKKIIEDNDQEERGSHFAIGENYVDYTSPETGESITDITKDLIDREFLKLERTVRMNKS